MAPEFPDGHAAARPFLAAMHLGGSGRGAQTPSALTRDDALAAHFACTAALSPLLGMAIALDNAWVARAGAALGAAGALAFGFFCLTLLHRVRVRQV